MHFPKCEETKIVLSQKEFEAPQSKGEKWIIPDVVPCLPVSRLCWLWLWQYSLASPCLTPASSLQLLSHPKKAMLPGLTSSWPPALDCLLTTCPLTLQITLMIPKPGALWSSRGWSANSRVRSQTGESVPLQQPQTPAALSASCGKQGGSRSGCRPSASRRTWCR